MDKLTSVIFVKSQLLILCVVFIIHYKADSMTFKLLLFSFINMIHGGGLINVNDNDKPLFCDLMWVINQEMTEYELDYELDDTKRPNYEWRLQMRNKSTKWETQVPWITVFFLGLYADITFVFLQV